MSEINNHSIKNKLENIKNNNDRNKRITMFSVFGSIYLLVFLAIENFLETSYPWFLYCVPPILLWPAAVSIALLIAKKLPRFTLSWIVTITISIYYIALNFNLSSNFPWSFIVISAVLWYPFSVMLAKNAYAYSIFGFIWAIIFFGGLNFITTPDEIWAVYPIFGIFWWPLSVFFFKGKKVR